MFSFLQQTKEIEIIWRYFGNKDNYEGLWSHLKTKANMHILNSFIYCIENTAEFSLSFLKL